MRLQLVSCICIFFKKCQAFYKRDPDYDWHIYADFGMCIQTDTVATEFVSVIYAGTQTRKSSSTSSDITFILENLEW